MSHQPQNRSIPRPGSRHHKRGTPCSPLDLSIVVLKGIIRDSHLFLWQDCGTSAECTALQESAAQLSLTIFSTQCTTHNGRYVHLSPQYDYKTCCIAALKLRRQHKPPLQQDIQQRHDLHIQQQAEHCLQLQDKFSVPEAALTKALLANPPACLNGFSYLHDREWTVCPSGNHMGIGDLVFSDGQGLFAVIEVKHIGLDISGELKRLKRRKVLKQALKYGRAFADNNPDAVIVIAGAFTEESEFVTWVNLNDQHIDGVKLLAKAAAGAADDIRHASSPELSTLLHSMLSSQPMQRTAAPLNSLSHPRQLSGSAPEERVHTEPEPVRSGNDHMKAVFAVGAITVGIGVAGCLLRYANERETRECRRAERQRCELEEIFDGLLTLMEGVAMVVFNVVMMLAVMLVLSLATAFICNLSLLVSFMVVVSLLAGLLWCTSG